MDEAQFTEMMERLLKTGLHITIFMEDGTIWFNLNTGMKSHLYVRYDADKRAMAYKARYDKTGLIKDWSDLKWVARDCMHGRDYLSPFWNDILAGKYDH